MSYTNPVFVIYELLGYVILYFILSSKRKQEGEGSYAFIYLIIYCLCLFSVHDSDYFHYRDIIDILTYQEVLNIEKVYIYIVDLSGYNYIVFRIIVWGAALLILYISYRRLCVNIPNTLIVFVSSFLVKFSYSRVSLAMSILFLGYTFLIKPFGNKLISKIIGVLIIAASCNFHKSAIVAAILYLLSLIKYRGKWISIILIALPLILIVLNIIFSNNLKIVTTPLNIDLNILNYYISQEPASVGVGALIQRILERTPYYIVLVYIYVIIFKKQDTAYTYDVICLANLVIIIVVFSSSLIFSIEGNTSIIYYRCLYFSIIPLSVLLPKLVEYHGYTAYYKYSIIIWSLSTVYCILYSAYNMLYLYYD